MENKASFNLLKNLGEKGQGTIEYILILSVVAIVTMSILNSPIAQKFIGADAELFSKVRRYFEYTYRNCSSGDDDNSDYNGRHECYHIMNQNRTEASGGRFFTFAEPYPKS